jgi:hypothetical protein
MLKFEFKEGRKIESRVAVPEVGTPCLYFLSEKRIDKPFYIGEYGKSKKYDIVGRISQNLSGNGTLSRVSINMRAFNNQVPSNVVAHIFILPDKFEDNKMRKSLEAWVIYITCHQRKIQDKRFAVTRYNTPKKNYSNYANQILNRYEECFIH